MGWLVVARFRPRLRFSLGIGVLLLAADSFFGCVPAATIPIETLHREYDGPAAAHRILIVYLPGSGDRITPGWLFRAGLASCLATCIAMRAAAAGIELSTLSVEATSRSDSRGLLGVPGADGEPVNVGPSEIQLRVRLSARGVSDDRLRSLVDEGHRCSPVPAAVQHANPVVVHVEVDPMV